MKTALLSDKVSHQVARYGRRLLFALLLLLAIVLVTHLGALIHYHPVDGADYNPQRYLYSVLHYLQMLVTGTLGYSHEMGKLVSQVLMEEAPASFILMMGGLLFSIVAGVALGYTGSRFLRSGDPAEACQACGHGATRENSAARNRYFLLTTIGLSVPEFLFLAVFQVALLRFFQWTHWNVGHLMWPLTGNTVPLDYIIPLLAVSFYPLAYIARVTTGSFDRAFIEDYVRTAHSKGLTFNRVVLRHVLKNVAVDVLDAIPGAFTLLVANLIVVEYLYQYPGIALRFMQVVRYGFEAHLVAGIALLFTATFFALKVLSSWLQVKLDPRRQEIERAF